MLLGAKVTARAVIMIISRSPTIMESLTVQQVGGIRNSSDPFFGCESGFEVLLEVDLRDHPSDSVIVTCRSEFP